MPKLTRRPPAYTLHKASGQGRCKDHGRTIYFGPYGTPESWEKYSRYVAERYGRQDAAAAASRTSGEPMTVTEMTVAYFRHCETYYTKGGQQTGQVDIIRRSLRVLRLLYGSEPVDTFGPLALEACRNEFVRQGLCRREVNRRTNLIRQCFKWAVAKEFASPSLYHALTAVDGLRRGRSKAPDHAPVAGVPDAIIERTLEHLSPTVAAMVRVQALTGMRGGEVVIMRGCDLHMSGPIWEYEPATFKTEHHEQGPRRIVMIGPRAQAILRQFLQTDTRAYLFSPQRAETLRAIERRAQRRTELWPSHIDHQARKRRARRRKPLGDHYDVASYRRAIARACDLAAVPRWSPHRLRHSAATKIRRQFGLEAAQATLGHAELDATQIYAEKSLDAARHVARELG
jgi:integrase